jgi:beta-glucosidase
MSDSAAEELLYRDPSHTIDERAADLLARMNLDEKLGQLGCVWSTRLVEKGAFSEKRAEEFLAHGTGHITRIAGSTGLRPSEVAAFANAIQRWIATNTRLGIPAIVHEESTAGFMARDATQFPQAIGLASSWDPDLVREVAEVIRAQMRAVGAHQALAPVLDVARDPRWGRVEETYGEDPYLVSRIGVAYVQGLQSEDLATGVAATAKHFLGYGLSEGGMNHAPVQLGPRQLREVYARPFAAAIREAGLASVMNAYNEIDGLACAGSAAILDDLLRGELGFAGVVVADYFAVRLLESFHNVAADRGEAGKIALEAGLDIELPQTECYGAPLRERIERGELALEVIDRAVLRALRIKLALGLFEAVEVDVARSTEAFGRPEHHALARRIAARGIVLLRNEGPLLPLDRELSSLAVIGPSADDPRLLQGDYSYPAHLEIMYEAAADDLPSILPRSRDIAFTPGPYYGPIVTPLAGIRAAVSRGTRLHIAPGCDISGDDRAGFAAAVAAAERSEVAIVLVGGKSGLTPSATSGEFRDASDLSLTGVQQQLVEAVVATSTPTVVVLVNGRCLALPWIAEHVPSIVEAWLPGEAGGDAIADILFGKENPGGRLPISMPRGVGQVPLYYGHKSGGGRPQAFGEYVDSPSTALFPFGHGLSYTRFEYGALVVSPQHAVSHQILHAEVEVANVGDRDGDEVVQLYLRDPVASVTRPVLQLVGFARVRLGAGERRRIRFEVDPAQAAFYDAAMQLVLEPGELRFLVGASSQDIRTSASLHLDGAPRVVEAASPDPTRVVIL